MCRFLGRRHDVTLHALMRPASEKRQGTKSREVGQRWCSERYGDYMSAALSSPISRPFSLSSILLFDLKSLFFRPDPDLCGARRAKSVKDGAIAPPSGLVLD
jgi:hypothetical protein